MTPSRRRRQCLGLGLASVAVAGCATSSLPGYQTVYQGHGVPNEALDAIAAKFRQLGLTEARVTRDAVGRVQLDGRYRDDDEVEQAFVVVQALVGLAATSPRYPMAVLRKRWEEEAAQALRNYAQALQRPRRAPAKRALVVGINTFADSVHLRPIQGEDDARAMAATLRNAGYQVDALLGPAATRTAIERSLAGLHASLGLDDRLFIYVSSHGALPVPSPEGRDARRMSIVAYDSGDTGGWRSLDAADYQLRLQQTSVRDRDVQRLAQFPCRLTRVFIDTCYSGDMLLPASPRPPWRQALPEAESISWPAWTGPRFSAGGGRLGYSLLTATSPGQLALGPPPSTGVFPSPLAPDVMLRGSYFTQAFLAYLAHHGGALPPAFDDASRFTADMARRVSQGRREQQPRRHSTLPPEQDWLST
jgi:hypothetical protein